MNEPEPNEQPEERQLPEKPTPEQAQEAERLLQQASVARIRGQQNIAERALKEASEIAPGSAAVRAALGDELWGRGQYKKARDEFELAHLLEPENPTYETKWAEAILGSAGDPIGLTTSLAESYASSKTAALLSVFIPGLGNIVLGQTQKGATMLAVWIAGWAWAAVTPNGLSGIPHLLGFKANVDRFNAIVLVPLAMVVMSWLWAVFSTAGHAKNFAPKKIERPAPPGEGSFD